MSIESRRYQYGKVFGHWQIKGFLGSGSGGKTAVFRLEHTESKGVESALKVVGLIEERGSIDSLSSDLRKEYEKAREHCYKIAEQEILLMNQLQGNTNIVDYLDHTFVDWSDETGFGRDMLIRMEKLTDLREQIHFGKQFSREKILKIGRDISNALTLCHKKGILHRDIKPENIFVNKDGNYKLGDFGISRIVTTASTVLASTGIGTPQYWAPEQTSGSYDTRVDIYSLGLVLYELSNRNHLPFAESFYIRESEIHRRMLGEVLPAPSCADPALAQVILKACAYRPEDRYQTAEELLWALNNLHVKNHYDTAPAQFDPPLGNYSTMPVQRDFSQQGYQTEPAYNKYGADPVSQTPVSKVGTGKNSTNFLPWVITALAVILLVIVVFTKPDQGDDAPESTGSASVQEAETTEAPEQAEASTEQEETYVETVPTVDPIYLNELGYCAKNGKVWTRSNTAAAGTHHTAKDAPACWKDENTPGHTYGVVKDNCGNVYNYGIHIDGSESRTYTLSFDLDGKYTTLSGVCACPAKDAAISSYVYNASTRYEKYFEIYGDGKLLFTSKSSRYDGNPQSFTIDVTGIRILTIQYPSTDGPNEIATLYDALLS